MAAGYIGGDIDDSESSTDYSGWNLCTSRQRGERSEENVFWFLRIILGVSNQRGLRWYLVTFLLGR